MKPDRRYSSQIPSALTIHRLPPRQRWNARYAGLPPEARRQPTPLVAEWLARLPEQGRALDVAAGAGRNTVALARHGLRVDAVDISEQGLALARRRVQAAGLPDGRVQFILADIERPWLPKAQYDVIVVTFFLHRPLFPLLQQRLAPGGWLIYESFTVDQPVAPDQHPIRPHFLLRRGELRAAFAGLDILYYDEGLHEDKATAQLVGQKRGIDDHLQG